MRDLALRTVQMTRDLSRGYIGLRHGRVLASDIESGRVAQASAPGAAALVPLVLSTDETRVLAAWRDHSIAVLDAATLAPVRLLAGSSDAPTALALSPEGTLAVAIGAGVLTAWRVADDRVVATADLSPTGATPTAIAFSRDGDTLWGGTSRGNLLRFAVSSAVTR